MCKDKFQICKFHPVLRCKNKMCIFYTFFFNAKKTSSKCKHFIPFSCEIKKTSFF